jgi:hypothetical protein
VTDHNFTKKYCKNHYETRRSSRCAVAASEPTKMPASLQAANEALTIEEQRELATLQRTAEQRLLGVARRAMSAVGHYPLPP